MNHDLTLVPIPAFNDNYIWAIVHPKNHTVAIVDPGDASPVIDMLATHGWTLNSILITHHHPDHVGGINTLIERHNVPVYGPANEIIPHCAYPLSDGDSLNIPALDLTLKIMEVPGHTIGHIAYFNKQFLLCGDTLFAGGCGRLFEGTAEQLHHSLMRLAKLPKETLVCCAHEYTEANLRFASTIDPHNKALMARLAAVLAMRQKKTCTLPSTIEMELATNPFLRCDKKALQKIAGQHTGRAITHPADVFATLRMMKDSFTC